MNVLEFGGRRQDPAIRWLYDMRDVLYDQKWAASAENVELYYMYRDLYLSLADRDRLIDIGIRYDITIIPPRMLGSEYVKTTGHYHPVVPGGSVSYPELYEVLEGEALYLLQRSDLTDVVVVKALSGDKVLVPPGYGHITINASNKRLKMANFVARDFSSEYDAIREMAGGAYYLTVDGYIRNEHYSNVPPLRFVNAMGNNVLKRFGLSRSREMYPGLRDPGGLAYLTSPDEYPEIFEGLIE